MSTDSRLDTSKVAASTLTDAATVSKPNKAGGLATWADDRLGLATVRLVHKKRLLKHW